MPIWISYWSSSILSLFGNTEIPVIFVQVVVHDDYDMPG